MRFKSDNIFNNSFVDISFLHKEIFAEMYFFILKTKPDDTYGIKKSYCLKSANDLRALSLPKQ